jgi:hypothetical protein
MKEHARKKMRLLDGEHRKGEQERTRTKRRKGRKKLMLACLDKHMVVHFPAGSEYASTTREETDALSTVRITRMRNLLTDGNHLKYDEKTTFVD